MLNFPWEMFLQAQEAKNKNREQLNQNIQGIGAGIGQIGQAAQQYKQMNARQKLGELMAKQSQPTPPGLGPNAGPVVPNFMQQAAPYMMQLDPQGVISGIIQQNDPFRRSEIDKNNAMTGLYKEKAKTAGQAKPQASVWVNPADASEVSLVPKEGFLEYKTSVGDALNKGVGSAQSAKKTAAIAKRAEALLHATDVKQIDTLVSRVGITPKQLSMLQGNTVRAARAIEILSKPTITYQELALGEIDLTGLMQGGVPQADEIKSTHFPGWQEQWAGYKTYATGHPTDIVPEDIKDKVLGLISGVVVIDNKFIDANKKFSTKMLGPTIRGGIDQFTPAIDDMTKTMTMQDQPKQAGGWSYVGPAK